LREKCRGVAFAYPWEIELNLYFLYLKRMEVKTVNKEEVLYQKQENNEKVDIRYNISTRHVGINSYYIDSKGPYKRRLKLHPNYSKENYKREKELHPNYIKDKYKRAKELHPDYTEEKYQREKKYRDSEHGKQVRARSNAKQKGQGWILAQPNPFDKSVKVAYHHWMGAYVIAIPNYLHTLFSGRAISHEQHEFQCMQIIKQIYLKD